MKSRVLYPGTNSMLEVTLNHGESVKAESGAMVSMSDTIDVEGKMEGGFLKSAARMLAGEKFFFQTLKANRGSGTTLLAPSTPGDIKIINLDGVTDYIIQKDGFMAGSEGIEINTKIQNLTQGFLSGEGFFILKVSGKGQLVVSSFGAIHEINLKPGEQYIVDNSHLVAWPSTTNYTIDKASKGWISSFTSGEGVVCKFTGPGKIYIQTRNADAFGSWISKFFPNS